jgi:hypothetical protein
MRFGVIPSFIHHTDNLLSPNTLVVQAKGTPLSVQIISGSPYFSKQQRKRSFAASN